MKQLMRGTDRRALVAAIRERYQAGNREEKTLILPCATRFRCSGKHPIGCAAID